MNTSEYWILNGARLYPTAVKFIEAIQKDAQEGMVSQNWTEDDARMWKEQCRVGDIAFQQLFCTFSGKPVPEWAKGVDKVYSLLETINDLKTQLKESQEFGARMKQLSIDNEWDILP